MRFTWLEFLKDVFICALGAYGGPEAHYGVFINQLVHKKAYLKEEELVELMALCTVLPGPSSTQTITAIGYQMGGPLLGFLTLLVWALPAIVLMTGLSFFYIHFSNAQAAPTFLKFIGPMAVGFIVLAAFQIGKKVATDFLSVALLIFSFLVTWWWPSPWTFPLVFLVGAALSLAKHKTKAVWTPLSLKPPWLYGGLFIGLAVSMAFIAPLSENRLVDLFESFYRYGYLVFGGGQVVVPLMHSELVVLKQYMSNEAFLTGYGLVQGLPGPMFNFSAFAGAMANSGTSALNQVLGGLISGVAIFLPGTLLIYFIYPLWAQLRNQASIKIALKGINAVAGGLLISSALSLSFKNGLTPLPILISAVTILLLLKKAPAPLVVLGVLGLGFVL